VIRDIASLTEEAARAVKQWKFKPARLDGHPVATPMVVAFTFSQPTIAAGISLTLRAPTAQ
jgi:hypothetical protein